MILLALCEEQGQVQEREGGGGEAGEEVLVENGAERDGDHSRHQHLLLRIQLQWQAQLVLLILSLKKQKKLHTGKIFFFINQRDWN